MVAEAQRERWIAAAVLCTFAVGFAACVWAALPDGVVAMNDDFGYLRSVVETLQRGRPWTDDWLEPWNAGLSVLSALVWRATDSFLVAIQGVQAALAGLTFALLAVLLRKRGLGWGRCLVVGVIALTTPTVFWKVMEYTGVMFALPCLLLATWAAERGRWWLFLGVWLVALATRQSAAAWGALPLVAAWTHWRGRSGGYWCLLVIWAAGVVAYFLLLTLMNRTHAQGAVTGQMWANLRAIRVLELGGIGALVFFGAVGLSAWFGGARWRVAPWWQWAAVVAVAGWLGWGIEWHDRVYFEHSRFRGAGQLYLQGLLIVAAAGWLTHAMRLRRLLVGGGVAALVLVCLRRDVWDYYYIDLFVFGFLAVETDPSPAPDGKALRWACGAVGTCAAVALAWCHSLFVVEFKAETDVRWGSIALAETAQRDGRLQVTEIARLPFGYVAWELYPVSLRRRPDGGTDGENFFDYVAEGGVEVKVVDGERWSRRWISGADLRPRDVVARGEFPLAWCTAQLELARFAEARGAPPKRSLPASFVRPIFPLNDAEWATAIRLRR